MKRLALIAALTFSVAIAIAPAWADEDGGRGFGVRLGLGLDPDQFVVGAQTDLGPIFSIARLTPSADLGVGNDVTTFAFNGDIIFRFFLPGSDVSFYGGGGPTLVYWDADAIDGDLEVGLSLVGGARLPMGGAHLYNLEARLGISDVPDFRLLLGILLGAGKSG